MMKMVKKAPWVSFALIFLMWLGLHLATDGSGSVDNMLWVSDQENWSIRDLLSMLGHKDNGHWLGNSLTLAMFGFISEMLLGRKRYIGFIAAVMMATTIIENMVGDNGSIGASGWLAATPSLALYAVVRSVVSARLPMKTAFMPGFVCVAWMSGCIWWDIANIDDLTIGHQNHLIGYGVGFAFFFAAIPLVVKGVRRDIRKRKALKVFRKKGAILTLERIAQGELRVSDKRHQQLKKWAA